MSVTDIAYSILKSRGKALHFKELISEVMRVKAMDQANSGRLIAQMHTEINLDSRFYHQGGGEWGLREWMPKANKVVKIRPEPTPAPVRNRLLRDVEESDDDIYEDEEEGAAPDDSEEEYESDAELDEYEEDEED